jgi:hypothetical protein
MALADPKATPRLLLACCGACEPRACPA